MLGLCMAMMQCASGDAEGAMQTLASAQVAAVGGSLETTNVGGRRVARGHVLGVSGPNKKGYAYAFLSWFLEKDCFDCNGENKRGEMKGW